MKYALIAIIAAGSLVSCASKTPPPPPAPVQAAK
jgi:hypothetical protein